MNKIVKLALILFAFSAIMAACLGGINMLTADRIAAINAEKLASAMEQVLPADSYNEVEYKGNDTRIQNVYKAGTAGHTVKVAIGGSQGTIELIVGVDTEGAVSGISIVAHSETPGLGAVAAQANDKGQSFRDQFVGKPAPSLSPRTAVRLRLCPAQPFLPVPFAMPQLLHWKL